MKNNNNLSMIIILQLETKMSLFLRDACEIFSDEMTTQQKSVCVRKEM